MYCIHFFRLFNRFDIYFFRVKHLDSVTSVFFFTDTYRKENCYNV